MRQRALYFALHYINNKNIFTRNNNGKISYTTHNTKIRYITKKILLARITDTPVSTIINAPEIHSISPRDA